MPAPSAQALATGIAFLAGFADARYTLKSSVPSGNYNDDNLVNGNVRPVAYGISAVGDLSNLAASDAAFLALEATRNSKTAAAGDIRTGKSVTIAGSATNGSIPQSDIMPASGGTSDKLYSAAEEAARNTVVTPLSAVPSPANGGPAAWLQLNVSRVGTGDKKWSDAELAAANTAYENGRNDPASLTNAKLAASAGAVKIKGTTYSGSAPPSIAIDGVLQIRQDNT